MDVKLIFRNKSLQLLLSVLLITFISANTYSASNPLVRSVTRVDKAINTTPTVTSSNSAVATATITGTLIVPGIHNLSISSLAQAKQMASANTYPTHTSMLGITETLTITVGSSQITVDVSSTDSLKEIADKINSAAHVANLNAFAYIVATQPGQYQLVVGSTQTGVANAVSVSESGVGGNILAISTVLTHAGNAVFTFDGLSYSTSSNNNIIGEWLIINLMNSGEATLTVNE